ncbi:hypothetical protein FOZ63_030672, partial [Perkinsus olseni]
MTDRLFINPCLGLFHCPLAAAALDAGPAEPSPIQLPQQGGLAHQICLDFLFGPEGPTSPKPRRAGRKVGRMKGGVRDDAGYGGQDNLSVAYRPLPGTGASPEDTHGQDLGHYADRSWKVRLRWWLMMYTTFTEGLEEGLQLNVVYYMKEDLLMSPATSALVWGISRIPWLLKPLLAFTSDSIPIFGYRRKPYLIGSAGVHILSLGLLSLCHAPHSIVLPLLCLSLRSTVRAWTAAISQAILVEDNQGGGREAINNIVADFFWVRAVGIVISSYGTGLLLEVFKPHVVFVLFGIFPATTCITTWFMHEERVHVGRGGVERGLQVDASDAPSFGDHLSKQYNEVAAALGTNSTLTASLVNFFFYMSGPNYDQALYYYYIDKLGFSPEIMGQVQMFKGTARLTGPLLYKFFLSRVSFKTLVEGLTVVSLPLYMLPALLTTGISRQLGIPDAAFAIS